MRKIHECAEDIKNILNILFRKTTKKNGYS